MQSQDIRWHRVLQREQNIQVKKRTSKISMLIMRCQSVTLRADKLITFAAVESPLGHSFGTQKFRLEKRCLFSRCILKATFLKSVFFCLPKMQGILCNPLSSLRVRVLVRIWVTTAILDSEINQLYANECRLAAAKWRGGELWKLKNCTFCPEMNDSAIEVHALIR